MNTWNLRDEILSITHRWYWIVVCFLAGALIGWAGSYLWPSPYRATMDVYVGLNAYRSPYDTFVSTAAQQQFRLVDDYKSWQMQQLNKLALTDEFLDETLKRLQVKGSAWDETTPQDLRDTFKGVWRNVGVWHLVAEGRDRESIAQAVKVWSDVVVEWMNASIEHSKNVVALDIHLAEWSETQVELEHRREILELVHGDMLKLQADLAARSPDQPVPPQTHWEILAQAARAADWAAGWDTALEAAPPVDSPPPDYLIWLERLIPLIEQELNDLPLEIEAVEQQRLQTETQYKDEVEKSRALAATLEIEKAAGSVPQVEPVRPVAVMTLVGAFLGLLVWAGWQISLFGREARL